MLVMNEGHHEIDLLHPEDIHIGFRAASLYAEEKVFHWGSCNVNQHGKYRSRDSQKHG